MTVFHAIILSIVEGLTEFLPISSTGHMILVGELLGIPETEFLKTFQIAIQLGAILAIAGLFIRTVLENKALLFKLGFALVPTVLVGFFFFDYIKGFLLGSSLVTAFSLFIGGIILILVDKNPRQEKETKPIQDITIKNALVIGLAQSLAAVPGVSRSAATILGSLSQGLNREQAVLFSFLLAVPTMVMATGYDLLKTGWSFSAEELTLLAIGFVGAFLSAYVSVKFFLAYVKNHSLFVFGVYRIILALVFLGWSFLSH